MTSTRSAWRIWWAIKQTNSHCKPQSLLAAVCYHEVTLGCWIQSVLITRSVWLLISSVLDETSPSRRTIRTGIRPWRRQLQFGKTGKLVKKRKNNIPAMIKVSSNLIVPVSEDFLAPLPHWKNDSERTGGGTHWPFHGEKIRVGRRGSHVPHGSKEEQLTFIGNNLLLHNFPQ